MMTIKSKILLRVSTVGLLLCSNPVAVELFAQSPAVVKKPVATVKTNADQVKDNITAFLKWYNTNIHAANNFKLLVKDSNNNYMIDQKASADYLNFLKSSKFISDQYIGYWKTYFDDRATAMKNEPMKEDMPEGFDMDFILLTQEPELLLNRISKIKYKIMSINSKAALVSVKIPGKEEQAYEFEMAKTQAGWQISYISTPNYD